MLFESTKELKGMGFKGFIKVKDLRDNFESIPKCSGVYMVLNPNMEKFSFLEIGTGGFFKGKNPNVDISVLNDRWIDNTIVIYIGQTGSTLRKRIGDYIKFGQNKPIGHWGGRYIWQIKDAESLIFCWMKVDNIAPSIIEEQLLQDFKNKYLHLPFANLR